MMARLRLLFAMLLLCLGTWVATLAVGGHDGPGLAPRAGQSVSARGSSTSPDAQQFISFLTRERFVVDDAAARTAPMMTTMLTTSAPKIRPKTRFKISALTDSSFASRRSSD